MLAAVAPHAGKLAEFFFSLATLTLLPKQTVERFEPTPKTST